MEPVVVFTGSPKNPDAAPVAAARKKVKTAKKTEDTEAKPAEKPAAEKTKADKPAKPAKTKTAESAKSKSKPVPAAQ
jgi:hypothetical protein